MRLKRANHEADDLYLHLVYSSDRQTIRSLGRVVTQME